MHDRHVGQFDTVQLSRELFSSYLNRMLRANLLRLRGNPLAKQHTWRPQTVLHKQDKPLDDALCAFDLWEAQAADLNT